MSLLKKKAPKDSDPSNPLAELPPSAVTRLAEILSRPPRYGVAKPSAEWLARQQETIAATPSRLHLRRSHKTSLAAFLSMDKHLRPKLCRSHGDLNLELIHWVFGQLKWECTTHTDRIRGYRNKFREGCPAEIGSFIDKTSGIATLYLSPAEFDTHFGPGLPDNCRLGPVETCCPACTVAIVGARAELLVYLRANMVARAKRGYPRLLALVDAWIACFGEEYGPAMMGESDALAVELKRIRGIMSERRKARKGLGGKKSEEEKKRTHKSSGHRGGRPAGLKTTKDGSPLPQAHLSRVDRTAQVPDQQEDVAEAGDGLYGADGYYEQFFQETEEHAEPDLAQAAGQSQVPIVNHYEFHDSTAHSVQDGPGSDLEPSARLSQVPAESPYEFHDTITDIVDDFPDPALEPGARLSGVPAVSPFDFQDFTADESSDDDGGDTDGDNHDSAASSPILSPFYAKSAVPAPLNFSRDNWANNTASADSGGDAYTWVTWTVHSEETEIASPARPASLNAPAVPAIPAAYASTQASSHHSKGKGKRPAPLNVAAMPMYPSSSVYSTDNIPVSPANSTDTARAPPKPVSLASTVISSTPTRRNWRQFKDPFADGGEQRAADVPISSLVSPGAPGRGAVRSGESGAWAGGREDVVTPEDSISCTVERRGERAMPNRRTPDWSGLYREG